MRGRRILVGTALVAALVAAACSSSTTGGGGGQTNIPSGQSFNVHDIQPPGEPAAVSGTPSEEAMYADLNKVPPDKINDSTVGQYFKQAPLEPEKVIRTENPKQGVTIKWDSWGVPYIYGDTNDDVAWGSGWAGTEVRMFAMDYIRYAGQAKSAELVPVGDPVAQDAQVLAHNAYTPQEAQAQLDALAQKGPEGQDAVSRINAFVEGINASRKTMCPTVTAKNCPKEYALFKVTPKPFTPADIVYSIGVTGGSYGAGGGSEAINARWLAQLETKFPADQAYKIFMDTMDPQDPEAQTTEPGEFPYGQNGPADPAAVAVPDLNGKIAPGSGNLGPNTPQTYQEAVATNKGNLFKLPLAPLVASNALLIGADRSGTGHPVAVFGPQIGYYVPELTQEEVLHGPGYNVRGISFVNLQLFVIMGHGPAYAWSATSAYGDVIDTVAETLCDPANKPVTVNSTSYVNATGACVPFDTWTSQETPIATGKQISLPVLKTRHGIVQYRTTVKGKPVAIVSQRSTYGREINSAVGFLRADDPAELTGQEAFRNAFAQVDFTFNWYYVDPSDIAIFTAGLMPLRAAGQDMALPRWGDAKWDWQGFLDQAGHPQAVNPDQGYLANWNNKPAIGERAADDAYGWARLTRVLTIIDGVNAKLANGGKPNTGDALSVMMNVATIDPLGAYLLPEMLEVLGDDPQISQYTTMLRSWASSGAHRVDRASSGAYTDQAAIALWDAWYPIAVTSMVKGKLGNLTFLAPQDPRGNDPSINNDGSAYAFNLWYQVADRDLRAVLGKEVKGALSEHYCGNGDLTACRATLKKALQTAVQQLQAQQKQNDPTKWVYPKSADEIKFTPVGIATAPPMDWQNRPTFQQVVTTANLPNTTPSVAPSSAAPTGAPSTAGPAPTQHDVNR